MPRKREHLAQVAVFVWAALNQHRRPELEFMYAVPNGGHRHRAVAAKMKAEGQRRGVPDICLPVPRGGYHGFYLEMKIKPNRLSLEQKRYLEFLKSQGYHTDVAWSSEEAIDKIEAYLEMGE
jgi:hypothetical protein